MTAPQKQSFGEKFFESMKAGNEAASKDALPNVTPVPHVAIVDNPIQRAMNDYQRMETEVEDIREKNRDLSAANMALVAEVSMLREELERSDTDRIRLQAVSSTLLGRLLSINDCIAGAVKESVRHGIEATEAKEEEKRQAGLEEAASEVQGILQRVVPLPLIVPATALHPNGQPSGVDWTPPQN